MNFMPLEEQREIALAMKKRTDEFKVILEEEETEALGLGNTEHTETITEIITQTEHKEADLYETALKELSSRYFAMVKNTTAQIYYYSKTHDAFDLAVAKDVEDLIKQDFPELTKTVKKGKKGSLIELDLPENFLVNLRIKNRISEIVEEVDLFQTEAVRMEKVDDILFIKRNKREHRTPDIYQVNELLKQQIINDFKEHFTELDEFLNWVVACRFSSSRRSSFLHLRLNAGFGKTFLKSIFLELALFAEIHYSDLKAPTGLKPVYFKNTLGMVLDEFTIFKQEFKDITNRLYIESKNAQKVAVEVFAKVFMSAEKSKSFLGGVDTQISDRINIIDKNIGKLEDREIFNTQKRLYYNVILNYVNDYVNNLIVNYVELGAILSDKVADKVLVDFHEKYKINNNENLEGAIRYRILLKLKELDTMEFSTLNREEKEVKDKLIYVNNDVYILTPKKTIENLLKLEDEDFYKKARYKLPDIENVLDSNIKNNKIAGKVYLSMKLTLPPVISFEEKPNDPENFDDINPDEIPF
jgi:hypothetical protein